MKSIGKSSTQIMTEALQKHIVEREFLEKKIKKSEATLSEIERFRDLKFKIIPDLSAKIANSK